MTDRVTVVISAAGVGRRLGSNRPKCLVEVLGRSLLSWQLALLDGVHVVVVAGFMADEVRAHALGLRPDIEIVLNPAYESTGTAASLALGAGAAREVVVSLDGDLLVAPRDLATFVHGGEQPEVGVCARASTTPVGALIDPATGLVTSMGFDCDSPWEWSGLVRFDRDHVRLFGPRHVFESLLAHLPIAGRVIDCVEIDEPEDLLRAEAWLARHLEGGTGWTSP